MKPQLIIIKNNVKFIIRFKSMESLENYLDKKLDIKGIKTFFETVYEKLNLLNKENQNVENL